MAKSSLAILLLLINPNDLSALEVKIFIARPFIVRFIVRPTSSLIITKKITFAVCSKFFLANLMPYEFDEIILSKINQTICILLVALLVFSFL